jgi:hypothetical protein
MKKYKGNNAFHQGWIDYIQGVNFYDAPKEQKDTWIEGWTMAAETR